MEESVDYKFIDVLTGHIIVADDSQMNLEAIKLNLAAINITENLLFCSDGRIALDRAKLLIKRALKAEIKMKQPI